MKEKQYLTQAEYKHYLKLISDSHKKLHLQNRDYRASELRKWNHENQL